MKPTRVIQVIAKDKEERDVLAKKIQDRMSKDFLVIASGPEIIVQEVTR